MYLPPQTKKIQLKVYKILLIESQHIQFYKSLQCIQFAIVSTESQSLTLLSAVMISLLTA